MYTPSLSRRQFSVEHFDSESDGQVICGTVCVVNELLPDLETWERDLTRVFIVDADNPKVRYLFTVLGSETSAACF